MDLIRLILVILMLGIMVATLLIAIYEPYINIKGHHIDSADMRHVLLILQCVLLYAVLLMG